MYNGIIGVTLIFIGLLLLFLAFRQYRKKALSDNTATTRIKNIDKIQAGEVVEIKGKAICHNPLTARLSARECIYYSYRIKDLEGEEYLVQSNKTGKWSSIPWITSNVACDGEMWSDFVVQDSTGKIKVYGRGAEVHGIFTHDKLYAGSSEEMTDLSSKVAQTTWALNRRQKPISGIGMRGQKLGSAAIATKVLEEIIPNNCQIYIIGKIIDVRGEKVLMQDNSGGPFIISALSEEALVAGYYKWMLGYLLASLMFLIIGAAFLFSYFKAAQVLN